MSRTSYLRGGAVAFMAALFALALPGSATAAPAVPGADLVTAVDAPAGELCSFPVLIQVRDGTRLHDSGHGAVFSTGPLVAVVTNETTHASLTLNISGPTLVDRSTGRTILVGRELILQPASRNIGPPFLLVNSGRVTFTEQNTIATRTGKVRNICAA